MDRQSVIQQLLLDAMVLDDNSPTLYSAPARPGGGKRTRRAKSLYEQNQLWLELFVSTVKRRHVKRAPREKPGNSFKWSDEDLDKVVRGYFHQTMHVLLDSRSALRNRQEAYDWLMVPFANPYRGERPTVLSFQFCCQWLEVSHAEVQERTIETMRQEGFLDALTGPKLAESERVAIKVA